VATLELDSHKRMAIEENSKEEDINSYLERLYLLGRHDGKNKRRRRNSSNPLRFQFLFFFFFLLLQNINIPYVYIFFTHSLIFY